MEFEVHAFRPRYFAELAVGRTPPRLLAPVNIHAVKARCVHSGRWLPREARSLKPSGLKPSVRWPIRIRPCHGHRTRKDSADAVGCERVETDAEVRCQSGYLILVLALEVERVRRVSLWDFREPERITACGGFLEHVAECTCAPTCCDGESTSPRQHGQGRRGCW